MLNLRKRLAGWKRKLLLQGGRIILIRHVLQSLSLYNVVAFDLPKTVLHRIDAIYSNFLWGDIDNKHKYHLINWKNCYFRTQEGGIGVRNLDDLNEAFAMKLWWRFRTSTTLWANFVKFKYASKIHPIDCVYKVGVSFSCLRILRANYSIEANMKWIIGKGEFNFLKEYWVLDGKLEDVLTYPIEVSDLTVA